MKIARVLSAAALLIGLLASSFAANATAATDAPSGWAAEDVKYMIQEGLVPKELQGEYKSKITRAEFAEFAALALENMTGAEDELHKVITEQRFTDSFDEHVYTAFNFGVVNGISDTKFEPARSIVRKEAAVMLGNILTTLHVEGLSSAKAPYIDYAAIPQWAQHAANITYNAKIFQGSIAGLEPDKPYTREQSIVTMRRLLNVVKQVEGISYRGKIFIAFADIDDVRVGTKYVKIGSKKSVQSVDELWKTISGNFPTVPSLASGKVTASGYTIETNGEDYKIKISW